MIQRWIGTRWGLPVIVFLIALLLRGLYLGEIQELPDFESPLVDAGYHDFWAWGIASGDWAPPAGMADPNISTTPYFRPPLPAYWLAAIYALFGHDYLAARIVQILLGSLSCVLVYFLGKRLFDRTAAGFAGILMATYWIFIYFDTEFREVTLLVFLYPGALLALLAYRDRPGYRPAIASGLLLGLAILAKPNTILFVPIAVSWMIGVTWTQGSRRQHLFYALATLLVAALCIVPVTIRNVVRGGDAVLVSSNGGINLYIGNNPAATGLSVSLPGSLPPFETAFDYPWIVAHVERAENRPLKRSEVSSYFADLALDYIWENPGRVATLCSKKAIAFWSAAEIISEKDLVMSRAESRVLTLIPLNFAAAFASALTGLILTILAFFADRRRQQQSCPPSPDKQGILLVLLLVGIYFLSFIPFFMTARFRVPIIPFMLLFSAYGLRCLIHYVSRRKIVVVALCVGGMALLYGLDHIDLHIYEYNGAKGALDRGVIYFRKGQLVEAEEYFRKALEWDPLYAEAHNNLSSIYIQQKRFNEAVGALEKAVELKPGDFRQHYNLAMAFMETGDIEKAMDSFDRALQLKPHDAELPHNIAQQLLCRFQHPAAARRFLERSITIDPKNAANHFRVGLTLLSPAINDLDGAISSFKRALELSSENAIVHNALGYALMKKHRRAEAIRHFERAIDIDPNNANAHRNLEGARREANQIQNQNNR